jgi:hypothetical protein
LIGGETRYELPESPIQARLPLLDTELYAVYSAERTVEMNDFRDLQNNQPE